MRRLHTELENEINALRDKTLRKEPTLLPKVLYHYTSASGLQGILESGTLWATDARFTNDTNELLHSEEALREVAKARLPRAGGTYKELLEVFVGSQERLVEPWFDVFVTCFSEHHDLLPQWIAYADNGRGYAIGIDTTDGGRAEHPHCCGEWDDRAVDTFQVKYDLNDLKVRFEDFLDGFSELIDKFEQQLEADRLHQTALRYLRVNAALEGIRYKHKSSSHEREWRFAVMTRPNFAPGKCRTKRGVVIPTVPLELASDRSKLPIQRIYVGPAHRAGGTLEVAELGVKALLRGKCQRAELEAVVKASKLTYRAL